MTCPTPSPCAAHRVLVRPYHRGPDRDRQRGAEAEVLDGDLDGLACRPAGVAELPGRGLDLLALRLRHVPHAADVLAGRVARLLVLDPVVQRPAVVRHLHGAVRAGGRAQQRRIRAVAGHRRARGQQRRPVRRTLVVAVAGVLGVLRVQVQRHALVVGQDLAELVVLADHHGGEAGCGRRLSCSPWARARTRRRRRPGPVASPGLLVLDPVVQRPAVVRHLRRAIRAGVVPSSAASAPSGLRRPGGQQGGQFAAHLS